MHTHTHTCSHTHLYIYICVCVCLIACVIYIYIYICVCVCTIWTDVKLLIGFHYFAGGLEPICLSSPTKLWHFGGWVVWSTTCTCKTQFELLTKLLHCIVSTLHGCHNLYCMHQNLPQIFAETISPTVLWFFDIFSPRSCRRRTLGLFGKQSPKQFFGFQHAGQNSMESG